MLKTFKLASAGIEVEIGKVARQADGAVWIKAGNNIVLSTAVANKQEKDFMGFFPLTVEYREKSSAAGKIPGGYIKREGRLSDHEVLVSRLIDRPIRPLFPKHYFNEVQLISTLFSVDGKFPTDILSIIGSSLALVISEIPFLSPVGAVQATKHSGEWKFNLSREEVLKSDAHLVIVGTADGICMVEGYCNNIPESELVDLLFEAHEEIKNQVNWQLEIQKEIGIEKTKKESALDWDLWNNKVKNSLPKDFAESMFADSKSKRDLALNSLKESLKEKFEPEIKNDEISVPLLMFIFDSILKEALPDIITKKGYRIDGRHFNQVRNIDVEVSNLPCVHGSSIFTRGQTQVLASVTLGTAQDAQRVEILTDGVIDKKFMLHYNFPPFSTGEVKMIRGVGRREIGHGYLAEKSFANVMPDSEKFPYTVRAVSDVLESNGSSSMATVCATTMALMDCGVPISDMVGGVAMGLMKDSSDNFHIITDILGREDALGLMDFKVSGTKVGIMAVQMDIKAKSGLTKDLLEKALDQARVARLHILGEMEKVLSKPRKDLSNLAPRVSSFKVDPSTIGAIVGPAGKVIKEIIAQTDAEIDIEDDGTVAVYAKSPESAKKATDWIKVLAGQIEVGSVFMGAVRRITDFGIFVELVPGKDGLLHISNIDRDLQRTLHKDYKINDKLKVRVQSYDRETGRISLIAPELKKAKKD